MSATPQISKPRTAPSGASHHEEIPLARLEDASPTGEAVGPVAVGHPELADDPQVQGIVASGRQGLAVTCREAGTELNAKAARLIAARRRVALCRGDLAARSATLVEARAAHRRQQQQVDAEQRFALLGVLPGWLLLILLTLIAFAELQLNYRALEVTATDRLGAYILAGAVGVAMVATAHLVGIGGRRLVDRASHWSTKPTGWHYLALLTGVAVTPTVVIGLHHLRTIAFAAEADVTGHEYLAWVQVFLLAVAALASFAHDQPMKDELDRRQRAVDDAEAAHIDALEDLHERLADEAAAAADHRSRLEELLADISITVDYTLRCVYAFAGGVQRAVERPQTIDSAAVVSASLTPNWLDPWQHVTDRHLALHPDDDVLPADVGEEWLCRLEQQQREHSDSLTGEAAGESAHPGGR